MSHRSITVWVCVLIAVMLGCDAGEPRETVGGASLLRRIHNVIENRLCEHDRVKLELDAVMHAFERFDVELHDLATSVAHVATAAERDAVRERLKNLQAQRAQLIRRADAVRTAYRTSAHRPGCSSNPHAQFDQ